MALPVYKGPRPDHPSHPSVIVADPAGGRVRFCLGREGALLGIGQTVNYRKHGKFTVVSVSKNGTAMIDVIFPSNKGKTHHVLVPAKTFLWFIDGQLLKEKITDGDFRVLQENVVQQASSPELV